MNVSAVLFLTGAIALSSFAQTKEPARGAAKPKPAGATSAKNTPKPKTAAKGTTAKKPDVKAAAKPRGSAKTPASATKRAVEPKLKPKTTELTEEEIAKLDAATEEAYQAALAVEDAAGRIAALKKFIKAYPNAKRHGDAMAMVVTINSQLGNDKLVAGDIPGALDYYKAAIAAAPSPLPEALFLETLAKYPANIYFRGGRSEAYEIAKLIENKVGDSVPHLLNVAVFYMSVENGSEARRLAERALKLDPASGAAYQSLGLASRMDFLLDEATAAYAKALELEPGSQTARRGLAEMKRSLGKADEAVGLYREILTKDEGDVPARTGLVLALFDAGKKAEAEAELAKSLEANPGNVILQAGAAYWYAANGEGDRAVELAQKAIAADPRFVWSHIALARGQIATKQPIAAEKTLLAARRFGNFPTLEYEIANARASAGFFREAADELAKSFSVKDGLVYTQLGGRIKRGSKDLNELVGFERRASIFAPVSGDDAEHSGRMVALLSLKQELDKPVPDLAVVTKAADEFTHGEDKMKVHRLIFAGTQLLEKKVAVPKVIELVRAAPQVLESGLEVSDPSAATMASELYDARTIAAARGDYVNVPAVLKSTLSSVLRGRVEELAGWAQYQLDDPAQASVHLKRAVSVLPVDSAWWRSSTWRLGTSLALEGKNSEALEMYIRSYKSGQPDPLKYNAIESMYRRINGHTLGLDSRIGANPSPEVVASTPVQALNPAPRLPAIAQPVAPPISVPASLTDPASGAEPSKASVKPESQQETAPSPTPLPKVSLVSEPAASPTPAATVEPTPESTPGTLPSATPAEEPSATPSPEQTPTPEPSPIPEPSPTPEISETQAASVENRPSHSPTPTPTPPVRRVGREPASTTSAREASTSRLDNNNGLFPPVIINIPTSAAKQSAPANEPPAADKEAADLDKAPSVTASKSKEPEVRSITPDGRVRVISGIPLPPEVAPCTLTLDQDELTIQSLGNERAVVVRRTDDGDVEGMTGASLSPDDVSVRRESLPGVKWTALFVVRSVSRKSGLFEVRFETPCGKKEVMVRVR